LVFITNKSSGPTNGSNRTSTIIMTIEQIVSVCVILFFVAIFWIIRLSRQVRNKKLKQTFQEKYSPFTDEHGELYQKLTVPMDEADRKSVRNYYRFFIIFLSLFVVLFFVILFFKFPSSTVDYLRSVGIAAFLVTAFVMLYNARKKTLANSVKTVIKGVITDKIKESKKRGYNYIIQISNNDKINITPKDYGKFTFGDIVQIELLGNPGSTVVNRKLTLIGKV
jgi:protein-S-isoprenylcysteine O-methyltransferase Ste14